MDVFEYSKPVTGKNNIGRKSESTVLSNLLSQGENIVIFEAPRTGITSLIQQTLYNMRLEGRKYSVAHFSALPYRNAEDFLCALAEACFRLIGSTPDEFSGFVREYMEGCHFVFDIEQYSTAGKILSLNWEMDENDIRTVLMMPYRMAAKMQEKLVVLIDDFQTLALAEGGIRVLSVWEKLLAEEFPGSQTRNLSWLLCGSQYNAMRDIFETKRYFYRQFNRIKLEDVDSKTITEHIVKGFLSAGKVVDRDLMLGVCRRFRGNLWYINHFCAICNSLSKGYIMEPVLDEALETLLSIHTPEFVAKMNDLTNFQIQFLRAVIDGNKRFSSSEVIRKYGLNSSANVRRLKDALCKKEIITFDQNDDPVILDPLFEYWVEKFYFEIHK